MLSHFTNLHLGIATFSFHDQYFFINIHPFQDAHELLTELLDRTHEEVKAVLKHKADDSKEGGSSYVVMHETTEGNSSTSGPSRSRETEAFLSSIEHPSPVDTNFKWFYKESSKCKM